MRRYLRRENCFPWLEDPERAQRLMDEQVQAAWPDLLNDIARSLNPLHQAMFQLFPVEYYWSTFQSEWASDILFRNAATRARLYPKLVQHGLLTFLSPDVMRFLGRNSPATGNLLPQFQAEVVSDLKTRPEGVRIKHRPGENTIKMYDKQGSVLRIGPRSTMPWGLKPSGRPRASRKQHRGGSGCARASPICTGGRRSHKPRMSAICARSASVIASTFAQSVRLSPRCRMTPSCSAV
jgi:hypothetical protein